MKKLYASVLGTLLVASIACYSFNKYQYEHTDHEAPVITIKEDDLVFYEYEDINYLDYVDVSDNSDSFDIWVVNEEEALKPGEKLVGIIAKDETGNINLRYLHVNIISNEEWNAYVKNNTFNYWYRNYNNNYVDENKGYADHDAFVLAQEFIGMPGDCNEVAQAFINSYYGEGYNVFNTYPISMDEAKPGDIIYYVNGGLGLQHYAVYLGGSSALHGNINGTTVIANVYMTHGSEPLFYRLIGIE